MTSYTAADSRRYVRTAAFIDARPAPASQHFSADELRYLGLSPEAEVRIGAEQIVGYKMVVDEAKLTYDSFTIRRGEKEWTPHSRGRKLDLDSLQAEIDAGHLVPDPRPVEVRIFDAEL